MKRKIVALHQGETVVNDKIRWERQIRAAGRSLRGDDKITVSTIEGGGRVGGRSGISTLRRGQTGCWRRWLRSASRDCEERYAQQEQLFHLVLPGKVCGRFSELAYSELARLAPARKAKPSVSSPTMQKLEKFHRSSQNAQAGTWTRCWLFACQSAICSATCKAACSSSYKLPACSAR